MRKRNIIVIGASAGGFDALRKLVSGLPAAFNAAVFIVWHMPQDAYGILPGVLDRAGKLPVASAVDHEPVKMGRIYIAPPDHHMLLEKDRVRVTHGPKENRFRPAVDPLFRSAAYSYGGAVIGIVLSGALDDGTAGLLYIKKRGGIAMVQDPEDAEVPSMPENAMQALKADYVLPVSEMAAVLMELIEQPGEDIPLTAEENDKLKLEMQIAMGYEASSKELMKFGNLTPYTCPECHGTLTSLMENGRMRFRCHTGHAFSADSLLATITENIEASLWNSVRSVQESVLLLNHMGDHFAESNQTKLAAIYFKKAKEAEKRLQLVRQAVLSHEQLSTDLLLRQAEKHNGTEK